MLAFILDLIYQFITAKTLNFRQSLFIGFLLALLPYVALRGPAHRLMKVTRNE